MNKKFKRLVAVAGALTMLSSVNAAFASNTATVTQVEVLPNGSEDGKTAYNNPATDNIEVTPSDLVRVTIDLKDAESNPANGEVTFLSHLKEAGVLSNENIQYIDQQTAKDGTVTVTFRPRPGNAFSSGDFIAMAGGEDVAKVDSFNYTVGQTLKTFILKDGTSVEEGTENAVTFTLDPAPEVISGVKIGNNALEPDAYTYLNGVLTILNAGGGRTPGQYTVTVSAGGYEDAEGHFDVTAKPTVTIPEGQEEEVINQLAAPVAGTDDDGRGITLKSSVTLDGTPYNVSYSINADTDKVDVTDNNKKITLKPEIFAAKVIVTAKVGNVEKQSTIAIVPSTTKVAFGNLELLSTENGADAFADDNVYKTVIEANKTTIDAGLVTALNLALGRVSTTDMEQYMKDALDYDGDGKITLAEYRVFKLLTDGAEGFTPSAIKTNRAL